MPHVPAGRTTTDRVARSLSQRQISNRDVYLLSEQVKHITRNK